MTRRHLIATDDDRYGEAMRLTLICQRRQYYIRGTQITMNRKLPTLLNDKK
jgi:hypothetical protein